MRKSLSILSRIMTLAVTVVILLSCTPTPAKAAKKELYIFNCGDYIAETTVEKFEKAYPEYDVIYEVFDKN